MNSYIFDLWLNNGDEGLSLLLILAIWDFDLMELGVEIEAILTTTLYTNSPFY